MKRFFIYSVIGLMIITASSLIKAQTNFIDDLGDIPLMESLELLEGTGFIFEQENGRLVEKIAITPLSIDQIKKYYNDALPALGWVKEDTSFVRDQEALTLKYKNEGSLNVVIFNLKPL